MIGRVEKGLAYVIAMLASGVFCASVINAQDSGDPAEDQSVESVQTILDALAPPVRTRGIRTQEPASIDLQSITFEFDSAELTSRGRAVLNNVGQALMAPQLAGARIIVEGHTDASGSDDYNQSLSERRADAARSFLLSNFELDGDRLVAVGYGESRLLSGIDPLDADNRRVTFVRSED